MKTEQDFKELVEVIERAGLQARAYFDSDDTTNTLKGDGSVVTEIDVAVEKEIVSYIRTNFPDDGIVGEEGSSVKGTSSFVWHIDPIDGTDNFLRKIPFCAVSVARLGDTEEGTCGIVHNPITNQTFASFISKSVRENEHIHVLNNEVLGGRAMISIARGREDWMKSASYNIRKSLGMKFGGGNSFGCCALELAYVAANRIDGVLTFGLNTYDYGAGLYLIAAGGGSISVFENGAWSLYTGSLKDLCDSHGKTIFASHAGVHMEALELIGDPKKWSD